MRPKERHWPRYYYVIATIAAVFTIFNAIVVFTHYYPIAPACQTTTLTTVTSLQTTSGTTATATQVTTATTTATATERTTATTTQTTTASTTETTTVTTSVANVQLAISIVPDRGWVLAPNGKRAASIPANESVTFTVKISNLGESPVRVYGMIINVEYGLSFGVYEDQLIQPGNTVELHFVFAAELPRPTDVSFSNIVLKIVGDGWSKDETIPIYLAH